MKQMIFICAALVTIPAFAHEGVKNPAVAARMNIMSEIAAATKVLGDMAKGVTAFEADRAEAAVIQISKEAAKIHDLFLAEEDDPKSEARPEIWTTFADFSAQATALKSAADGVGSLVSLDDVKAALPKIGATCASCHKAYRVP